MRKTTQAINITNWFAVDSILFGDRNPKDSLSEGEYKNYLTAKGAALSNLFEIYVKLNYTSKYKFANLEEIKEFGLKRGKLAKERAAQILVSEGVSDEIRAEIKSAKLEEGVSRDEFAKFLVDRKIKASALDIVMIESALASSKNKSKLRDFKGQILTDAYKVFRDALIKYAD